MAELKASTPTSITDLDVDSLVHCATYLSIPDISNMAMTCKFFRNAAYSDSIWHRLFRFQFFFFFYFFFTVNRFCDSLRMRKDYITCPPIGFECIWLNHLEIDDT